VHRRELAGDVDQLGEDPVESRTSSYEENASSVPRTLGRFSSTDPAVVLTVTSP
jgi:hypothetical protein